MTPLEILVGIVLGLLVNECCDVSPWLARKLVRWSAHRRYSDLRRAETRAEELVALIDVRPGKLFKLVTALGFAAAAAFLAARVPARLSSTRLENGNVLHSRILDATVDCLVRSGYAGTTTAQVMKLAGVRRRARKRDYPRADLLMAAAHHIAATGTELAFAKVDEIRRAPDPVEAGLDLMWEVHQRPAMYALVEMWIAARSDLELRERIQKLEPVARASLLEFVHMTYGRQTDNPQVHHALYTAMDTVRGILLMGPSSGDVKAMNDRWRRAKHDLVELMKTALKGDAA